MPTRDELLSAGEPRSAEPKRYDLIVVGGGPAGMGAAAQAVRGGLSVGLVDAGVGLGGQYWRQPAPAAGDSHRTRKRETADLHHDLTTFRRLRAVLVKASRRGGLDLLLGHQVWTVGTAAELGGSQRFVLRTVDTRNRPDQETERVIEATALVLATGAYDRVLPFPGWDLPGVLTAGGMQALLKGDGVAAGQRVAVGGTGPFLLPVASGLARRGATVVGVFESAPAANWLRYAKATLRNPAKVSEGAGYALALARHRVPYRSRSMIVAAHGHTRVAAVTVAQLTSAGQLKPGRRRRISVDAVGIGWGFTPQLDLPLALGCELAEDADGSMVAAADEWQRASVPGVYVAGEVTGVGGAALAVAEGRLAGEAVCADLNQTSPNNRSSQKVRSAIGRLSGFATAMHQAHPIPAGWREVLSDDTTVCRCEEISYAAIRHAWARHGAADPRQLKQLTRVGMGWCQGRVCGFPAARLTAELSGQPVDTRPTPRPVAAPVALGALVSTHRAPAESPSSSGSDGTAPTEDDAPAETVE